MYPDPEIALSRPVNMWVNFERFVVVAVATVDVENFIVDVDVAVDERDDASVLAQPGFGFASAGPHCTGLHPGS
jgi:hypothetical protein